MKYFLILISTLICCLAVTNKSGHAQSSMTVAIIGFKNSANLPPNVVLSLTNRFRSALANRKTITVLEREKMNEILKEQDFVITDNCNTNDCAIQVGQLLGAQIMVTGEFGKIGDSYTIDIRCIDVQSGRIFSPLNLNHNGQPEQLLTAMEELAFEIDFLDRKYKVRHISGDRKVRWKLSAGLTTSVARSSFMKTGYFITQFADLTLSDRFSAAMGLCYVVKKTSYISSYNATYHYLEIPLLLQYALFEQFVTRAVWTAYVGYAPSFKLRATYVLDGNENGIGNAKRRDHVLIAGIALRARRGYGFQVGFTSGLVSVKERSIIQHRTIYSGITYSFR